GSALLGWVLLCASSSTAAPVSSKPNLIIMGNSLSDTGNAAAMTGGGGYFDGRFSNSYMWNEYAAKLLNMNLVNRAYAGATTNNDLSPAISGNITIPSLHDQVVRWIDENPSPHAYNLENDVIEIEIGGNDILHNVAGLATGAIKLTDFATEVAKSIATDMQLLVDAGYKNIILWNLPAVDKTPSVTALNAGTLVKPIVETINVATSTYADVIVKNNAAKTQGIHVLDLNSLMSLAMQPDAMKYLGITDAVNACYTEDAEGNPSVCADPDTHFFYDGIHPASRMHYLWGIAAAILTEDPNATIDMNELILLANTFGISQSDRENNLITTGITSSESDIVPAPSATEAPSSSDPATSVDSTPTHVKCH
ncbi:hypothetical protein IWW50_005936, partial [Coemansia erecta]